MHFFWYLKTLTKHKNSKQTGRQNKNRKNDKIKIANLDVEKKLHRIKKNTITIFTLRIKCDVVKYQPIFTALVNSLFMYST